MCTSTKENHRIAAESAENFSGAISANSAKHKKFHNNNIHWKH